MSRVLPGGRRRDEHASASILMAAVLGLVVLLGGAALLVAAYEVAYHRVRAAADLAAVSAAVAFARGDDACGQARRSAAENGARVVQCDQVGDQVDYVVSVRAEIEVRSRIRGLPTRLQAQAHAGSA